MSGDELRSARRARFAALACTLPVALWHHVAWRRGQAHLLLGLAASPRLAVAAHLLGALAGAAWAWRGRRQAPWRAPLLLLAFAVAHALAMVLALPLFSAPAFAAFAPAAALALGALAGALAVSLARALAGLAFDRGALLDLLRVESLALVLGAGLAFLLAAERFGPLRAGLVLALGCAVTSHLGLSLIAPHAPHARRGRRVAAWACYALTLGLVAVEPWTPLREGPAPDPIVLARSSGSGRLVLTAGRGAFQLYVDGMLRLSTIDAARRREAIAHPAMAAAARRQRVLLLGGGDGGALRELLRYPEVGEVTLVEPEASLVELAAVQPVLVAENGGALSSPRVRARTADPVGFLAADTARYDVIVVDLLDPEGPRRSKWFTRHFYRQLGDHLAPDGVGALVASASPLAQRQAFWSVVATVEAAGLAALPYRAALPTLGPWGHVLFAHRPLAPPAGAGLPPGLQHLDPAVLTEMFALAPDEQRVAADVNLLHRQVLPRYRQ